MNLRLRTFTIITLTLVSLFVVLYLASSAILLKGFSRLEQAHVQRELFRATDLIDSTLQTLAIHAKDWAFWDDSYAFMADENCQYRRSNLVPGTFTRLNLDFLLYLRPGGDPLFAGGYVEGSSAVFELSPDTVAKVIAATRAHALPDAAAAVAGLISLNGRPVLVALAPVLTSHTTGPARGTLIMGRSLTSESPRPQPRHGGGGGRHRD